jgi:high affinity Mn2+ porin
VRFIALFIFALLMAAHPAFAFDDGVYSVHFQATTVSQEHTHFDALYSGENSLSPGFELRTSVTSTIFAGRTLWKNAEIYINPEVTGGSGLSATHGISGFPNGEIYRVDTPSPKFALARAFIRQQIELGGEKDHIEADQNQLARELDSRRLTVSLGKFSLNDFFDVNNYAHDPRTQFLNWAFMDNLAWDYAADTRGYTWGLVLEFRLTDWTFRIGSALEPKQANQLDLEWQIAKANGNNAEIEYRYKLLEHPGIARLLGYLNNADMGSYAESLAESPMDPDVTTTRATRTKWGFGLNLEQEIAADFGAFFRFGWNNGTTESWAFTECERTIGGGVSMKGTKWGREKDVAGLGAMFNGLSREHADYLASGGIGFILGDGKLNYAPEQIVELYYMAQAMEHFEVSGDFQEVINPGYNSDRGPVPIGAVRLHYEF